MSLFNPKSNFGIAVTERYIIAATLHMFNHVFTVEMIRNGKDESFKVPFYFTMNTGSERMLYDAFMKPEFDNGPQAETQYEKVPRGIINHTSTSLNPSLRTNPFIFGKYKKNTDKGLKTYYARYRPIPIVMEFECKILTKSTLDRYKISEQIYKLLYKNQPFQIDTDLIRIPATLHTPDEIRKDTKVDFSFNDKSQSEITFNFEVSTFVPNFDDESEIFAGKVMREIDYTVHNMAKTEASEIVIVDPKTNQITINIPDDTYFYHG